MKRCHLTVVMVCMAVLARGAQAGDEPDVMEILKKADEASKAVKAVTYEGESFGTGDLADERPRVTGTVMAKPARRGLFGSLFGGSRGAYKLRIEGKYVMPGSGEETRFIVATDGKHFFRIDKSKKVFTQAKGASAGDLLSPATNLFMIEFLHRTPFSDELNAKTARYEGTQDVAGVECHVVFVVYDVPGDPESRWYFGKEDGLPRRVDRIAKEPGVTGAFVQVIKALNTNPSFDKDTFRLERPEGFEEKAFELPKLLEKDQVPELLAVGTDAPEWELKTPGGQTVRLKDLRGNVVVLDFWATWCGPCKMAMPGFQKVHEQFKDKPVKVFGVNCWERGDAAAYMKKKKYTYGLLLDGDKVADAYHVSGIPTFYVIDPAGKIAHASSGFKPNKEKELARIIEKALHKGEL